MIDCIKEAMVRLGSLQEFVDWLDAPIEDGGVTPQQLLDARRDAAFRGMVLHIPTGVPRPVVLSEVLQDALEREAPRAWLDVGSIDARLSATASG